MASLFLAAARSELLCDLLMLLAGTGSAAAGCLHPDYAGFFEIPSKYLQWYRRSGPVRDATAPVVAVLLYRK